MGRGAGRSRGAARRDLCGAEQGSEQEGRDGPDRRGFCRRNGRKPGEGQILTKQACAKQACQIEVQDSREARGSTQETLKGETPCRSTSSCRRCRPPWRRVTSPSGSSARATRSNPATSL